MSKNYSEIVIALAGVCQAAALVRRIAYTGKCDEKYFDVTINSLEVMSPDSTLGVFGNDLDNIKLGLDTVVKMLSGQRDPETADLTRYAVSMTALEKRLMNNTSAQEQLRQRMFQLQQQSAFYKDDLEQKYLNIAGIYVDVISPLGQRIQVTGSEPILKTAYIQAKVRSLLLAGIRSAVLWQQVGGSRWQILFSRKKIVETANELLRYMQD